VTVRRRRRRPLSTDFNPKVEKFSRGARAGSSGWAKAAGQD